MSHKNTQYTQKFYKILQVNFASYLTCCAAKKKQIEVDYTTNEVDCGLHSPFLLALLMFRDLTSQANIKFMSQTVLFQFLNVYNFNN